MITPHEIEEKGFRMSFRGYNTDDVDDFLQEIIDSYTEIYESNRKLKDKTGRLSDAVGRYKSMEDTLSDALSVAGRSADEIEEDANDKAARIIKNAELTAQSIIAGAEQKIAEEQYRYENIKREIEIYKAKIIELLNAQLCVLKGYPKSASLEDELAAQTERNFVNDSGAVAKPELVSIKDNVGESDDKNTAASEKSSESTSVDTDVNSTDDTKKVKSPLGGANRKTVENILKGAAAVAAESNAADNNVMTDTENEDIGDTTEFESISDSDIGESEETEAELSNNEDDSEYKNFDTESLPCVSMDENGGYTVHKK